MRTRLTASKINRLRPKPSEYTVWDAATARLGVRVKPTGAKRFIHLADVDGRLRKTTIGEIGRMSLDEARAAALELDSGDRKDRESKPCPTLAEWVNGFWWPQVFPRLKESTKKGYQWRLKVIVAEFGPKPLNEIGRSAILVWFERHSRRAPGNANKLLAQLSGILNHAVRFEAIASNPASSIQRNPGKKMTRFLDDTERARFLGALGSLPERHRVKAMALKMLLFTGCRCGEILALQWDEVGEGALDLSDSKTGARRVWLGAEARAILDEARIMWNAAERPSTFVFPHHAISGEHLGRVGLYSFWRNFRVKIGLGDVRIHDLRHSFATEAVRQGVPLPVVSKLLGHSNIKMTMRYAHATDKDAEVAAEKIGRYLGDMLDGGSAF